jgi:hypothetical protein
MLHRIVTSTVLAFAALMAYAQPAQAQQTVNFTLGRFVPFGFDSRGPGDVFVANSDVLIRNSQFLAFDIDEFAGASIGGEWLIPLGNFFEAGAGVSFSQQTVPSVYIDYVDPDGTEIDQDLRLRTIPMAFTFRVLPLGQRAAFQPYFGAGLGVVNWRYSETGEFIDFNAGDEIFEDSFVATGTSTGPVILGGLRFAGRNASVGGEIRYQSAEGDLPSDFLGSTLDLGGWTYNFTVGVRF